MCTSIKLRQDSMHNLLNKEHYHYSKLVGNLLYLSVCTRHLTSSGSPGKAHGKAQYGALECSSGCSTVLSLDCSITFRHSNTAVAGYSAADYAGDADTRKSITGFVFILN